MTSFTDDICITFYNNHHDEVENMGGAHVLTKEQQRIYKRGEEIFDELLQDVKAMWSLAMATGYWQLSGHYVIMTWSISTVI